MIHIFLKVIMKKIFCQTLNPKNPPDLNIFNYELYPWNIIIMICNYMTFNIFSINVFTHMFTEDLRRKTNWLLRFHHLFFFLLCIHFWTYCKQCQLKGYSTSRFHVEQINKDIHIFFTEWDLKLFGVLYFVQNCTQTILISTFSAFDIRLISVTFTRHKLRLKRPFATCVCLSFGSKPNNHLSEGLFLDMFNDETKGPFVCCFKHVSRH